MSLTVWQFISQGGTVRTSLGYSVNNIVLTANTNPYPISGSVIWTENHSTGLTWDVNGNPQDSANNIGLTLWPISIYSREMLISNSTLSTANSYSEWIANNNIVAN